MEWDAVRRAEFLSDALPDASMIDIEAANIDSMAVVIDAAISAGIPWIASFHNFDRFPSENELLDALARAHSAGASAFKWAALLADRDEMSRMAEFQFRNHRMPVASMGMGALGAESRVLAALAGSVLNYGYLGDHPTAPGQWHAGRLKSAIAGPSART